jgi:hypothetical protein
MSAAGGNDGGVLRRLGLLGPGWDRRLVWALLALAVALYAGGYAAYYPRLATVDDEGLYLDQARTLVESGSFEMQKLDPLTDEPTTQLIGDYPVGMVALMAPFTWAFGPGGAFLASFLCVVAAVLLTARWIAGEGRSPFFALILLAFPALLVGGRLAMSDTGRTAAAALGLWLFFAGLDRGRTARWLASGFVAGAALSLRESSVLPFVPLFAGTVLRRDRGWWWLLLGGLVGTSLHLVTHHLAFGDPLFVRGTANFYPLDLGTIHQRIPLYLLGLLVLVPGGLWFGLTYRGRRRPEVVASVALFFLFYLAQGFGQIESAFLKRLVVGLRYFDPLLPVLAFAMAESLPRQLAALLARVRARRAAEGLLGTAAALWVAGTLVACLAVHPMLARWSGRQASIRDAIEEHVPRDAVLVTNGTGLRKFIDDVARPYTTLWRYELTDEQLAALRDRHGGYFVALLDRSDSAYWVADAEANEAFVARLEVGPPLVDLRATATDRLRIWRVGEPRQAAAR